MSLCDAMLAAISICVSTLNFSFILHGLSPVVITLSVSPLKSSAYLTQSNVIDSPELGS